MASANAASTPAPTTPAPAKTRVGYDGLTRLRPVSKTSQTAMVIVPAAMAKLISKDKAFKAELVEEGILFRAVDTSTEPEVELPAWMK